MPVLALPNFSQPFVIKTDASGHGLGAILMQDQRPIAYFSQVLPPRSQNKSIYERELMAIVLAVQKWRHYPLGRRFVVRTDQKSLKVLLEQRLVNVEYKKWLAKLLGFDFDIKYKPGLENKAADALSRKESAATLMALSVPYPLQLEEVTKAVEEYQYLGRIVTALKSDPSSCPRYALVGKTLLYKDRITLPKDSPFILLALQEGHDNKVGGHGGFLKTYKRVAGTFHWIGMKKDIRAYVAACEICQQNKYSTPAPVGLLQPLQILEQIWEDISMDFIEGLPKSERLDSILVMVDRLSKYAHFIGLKHPFTTPSVAATFVKEVVRLHGILRSIISDRDKVFLSKFWCELFRLHGTKLRHGSAYHPQTDGQTEVVNRGVETYLRCFTSARSKEWFRFLHWAEFSYNTSFHVSTHLTPFRIVYRRDPPPLLRFDKGTTAVSSLDQWMAERDRVPEELKLHLHRAQQKLKSIADKSLAQRINEKLAPRYYGPYKILAKVGKVAYRLELSPEAQIHPAFHVSQLRRAMGEHHLPTPLPLNLGADRELLVESEALMGVIAALQGSLAGLEVLIHWKGLSPLEAT